MSQTTALNDQVKSNILVENDYMDFDQILQIHLVSMRTRFSVISRKLEVHLIISLW